VVSFGQGIIVTNIEGLVMTTLDVNLPDALKTFVDEQVARRGYKDASAFLESLLEAERLRQVAREVEHALLETTDGPFSEWTDEDVEDIRRAGRRLIEKRSRQ
jgi:antitoxin ParD1/3/4